MTVQILCLVVVLDNTTTAAAQTSCKKVPDTLHSLYRLQCFIASLIFYYLPILESGKIIVLMI